MIDGKLRTLVKQYAQVGEGVMPSTEIGVVAQGVPKVGYTRISARREITDSGPVRIVRARYQLDTFAATLAQAQAINDRIRAGLDCYRGSGDAAAVLLIRFDDDSFGSTEPAAGANAAAARVRQDLFITYRE